MTVRHTALIGCVLAGLTLRLPVPGWADRTGPAPYNTGPPRPTATPTPTYIGSPPPTPTQTRSSSPGLKLMEYRNQGAVEVDVILNDGGLPIVAMQADFNFSQLELRLPNATACKLNPAIGTSVSACDAEDPRTIVAPCKTLSRNLAWCGGDRPVVGCAGHGVNDFRFRGLVAATAVNNNNAIPDGTVLYTCRFDRGDDPSATTARLVVSTIIFVVAPERRLDLPSFTKSVALWSLDERATPTGTVTSTPTRTLRPSLTPSAPPSFTPTQSATATESHTPSPTLTLPPPSRNPTVAPSMSVTKTPTPDPTATSTGTVTASATPAASSADGCQVERPGRPTTGASWWLVAFAAFACVPLLRRYRTTRAAILRKPARTEAHRKAGDSPWTGPRRL